MCGVKEHAVSRKRLRFFLTERPGFGVRECARFYFGSVVAAEFG